MILSLILLWVECHPFAVVQVCSPPSGPCAVSVEGARSDGRALVGLHKASAA